MSKLMQNILKLSVSERILMVEAIWESIAEDEESLNLTPETKQLLDKRLEAHRKDPVEGSTWEEVKARIKKQL